MFKKLLLVGLLSLSIPALAGAWNSDANLNKAMDQAVATYKAKGVAGLEDEARNCYAEIDYAHTNKSLPRNVEYCIAYELSATLIDRDAAKPGGARSAYFKDVLTRSMYQLERARVVTLPEQFERYLGPRFQKIERALPGKM